MAKQKPNANLYWVTTSDHGEDWFIFARTSRSAASFHEKYEGYNPRDAHSRLVMTPIHLPKLSNGELPCHAQIADLVALGFEVTGSDPHQRAVLLGEELFMEGFLQALVVQTYDNVIESLGEGRPNGTQRPTGSN